MHPIIYDVAVSLDGYISGPCGDISGFAHEGEVVDDYRQRLSTYHTAIMGRSTYQFGYKFGMAPGQNPYPHMNTIVVSASMDQPDACEITLQRQLDECTITTLKEQASGPIYLCGGGKFAGALLQMGLIDRIILKRAPIVLGGGVSLFGQSNQTGKLRRVSTEPYDNGYQLEQFVV